jgi:hypothetical protein
MAKRTIPAREEITDDVTGKPVDAQAETVTGTLGKDKFTLDLAPETAAALRAFLVNPADDDARRTLGALFPRPRPGSGSGSGSGSRTRDDGGKREYLVSVGLAKPGAGKYSAEADAAWIAHQAAGNGASEPATEPATA